MEMIQSHVYSEYSLLSSTNRIDMLVRRAKELGYGALALCDHHVMYGAVPFYQACLKHAIKPILGLELTLASEDELSSSSLVRLYAKNKNGYSNLLMLSTIIGHKRGNVPSVTVAEIAPYVSDLVIILPFRNNPIEKWMKKGETGLAMNWLHSMRKSALRSTFFLNIENESENDHARIESLQEFSNKSGIELLASHPCYYLTKQDKQAYQVLRAIKHGKNVEDESIDLRNGTFYLQSPIEMKERFSLHPEALFNTTKLADLCSVELELRKTRWPKYKETNGKDSTIYLRELCVQGCLNRYGEMSRVVKERLEKELSVITKMGFSDYFLIVWDFMLFAKKVGILTGPGRGSAAGSLVAYVLGITHVDPIKYDLLFERFLNPERQSMPDIDIDFPDHRRDEVIEYVRNKYGKEHVAQILTFGTLAARAVIRDVGKVLKLDSSVIGQLIKEIPSTGATLQKAYSQSDQLQSLIAQNKEIKKLWDIALNLEGLPRHTSTHAAGVVISEQPLTELIALQAGQETVSLTQATMDIVEQIGLLKFDFLGLRNLTLLERIITNVRHHYGETIELTTLPLDDLNTYAMLSQGDTTGVFQLESAGMRRALMLVQPTEFEDIVAVNALYRPGPMEFIPIYSEGKQQKRDVTYAHSDLEPILAKTYGVIVYQEQIMQIASRMADFSLAEADLLRRAISKKKVNELKQKRELFIKGAIEKGYDHQAAAHVFSLIERFADYGFNRSHAVAYSMISYQLAYLKKNYPLAFYTALLSSTWHQQDKVSQLLRECKERGYRVLPPSIVNSQVLFSIENKAIRFGLLPIAGIGIQAAQMIVQENKRKPFTDLFDMVVRLDNRIVNKKVIENLIKAGAMDEFAVDRATLLHSVDGALEFASEVKEFQNETEGLFTLDIQPPLYETIDPLFVHKKLEYEKEVLGFYLSGHPIEAYEEKLKQIGRIPISEAFKRTGTVRVAGLVIQTKKIKTKKGDPMAFAVISDETEEGHFIIFPNEWEKCEWVLKEGEIIILDGRVDLSKGRKQIIIKRAVPITSLKEEIDYVAKGKDILFLRITKQDPTLLRQVQGVLLENKGQSPVCLYYEQTKQMKYLESRYNVEPTERCITTLKGILGEEHVVFGVDKR